MNYRHLYHAGCFADVFKHALLALLLKAMQSKPSGMCYIDTHAGAGMYDLSAEAAQKTKEFERGIDLVRQENYPVAMNDYMEVIKRYPAQLYPGSPSIAEAIMREQDKIILNEKHPEEFQALKKCFARQSQVHCHQRDVYEFLPAMLPPDPRRALIMIDPPYEIVDEYERLLELLKKSLSLFPSGVYALWYPIKSYAHQRFFHQLSMLTLPPSLVTEFSISNDYSGHSGLVGTGMLIINPPWQSEAAIAEITQFLWKIFSPQGEGEHRTVWLKERE